jgi:hypothetical protein
MLGQKHIETASPKGKTRLKSPRQRQKTQKVTKSLYWATRNVANSQLFVESPFGFFTPI